MTIGIYALYWENSSMVYIGKGMPIENRFYSHKLAMVNGTHYNKKIMEQYNTHGEPQYIILEVCKDINTAKAESVWIKEFDSVSSGLNLVYGNCGEPYYGVGASGSVYSKTTVLKVFSLLYKGSLLLKEVASRAHVNISLCINIAYNRQHTWLEEEYPTQYTKMLAVNACRQKEAKSGTNNPMSTYSKYQILKVFSLLYKTTWSRNKIASRTNTKEGLAKSITSMGSHMWLQAQYPEQYKIMQSTRKGLRRRHADR